LKRAKTKAAVSGLDLGMIGTVGWMVALPVIVGILLGVWLEDLIPGRFPWILVLMLAGLATGMITAWIWLMREQKSIHRDREKKHDR
jgi:ATP synthase protein I